MSKPGKVCDNDYAVVINVVTAIRNKNTDRAAKEVADYRDECVKAERERVLAELERWWADAGPYAHLDYPEFVQRLRGGQ